MVKKMHLEIIRALVASLFICALLFFIFNNAVNTANFKRKGLYNIIFGIVFNVGFLIGYLYDRSHNIAISKVYIFPLVFDVLLIILVIINLVKAKKYNHSFKANINKSPNEQNFLYLVYQNGNDLFLERKQEGYGGKIIPFERKVLFYDEMLEKYFEKQKMTIKKAHMMGRYRIIKKKHNIYFCYLIDVDNKEVLNFTKLSKYDIINVEMNDFDKKIILNMLLNKEFDIEDKGEK